MALAGSVRLWMRIAYGVIFLLAAVGIILSNSRGALLGLGCGIVVVSLGFLGDLLRRKHSWAKVALVTCVFMAPIAVIGAWSVGSKMLAHRNNGDSGRLEFASIALDLIAENPMLGGGSRSFYDNHVKKWNPDELWVGAGDIQYVHNEYLQAAVDYGLIGAGLLLVLFCIAFFRATASLAVMGTKDHSEGEILGSIGALTGMGVQAFFSFVYHVLPDVMLLGCFLSLLLMRGQRQEDVDSSRLIAKRVFLGGAAIAVLLLALPDARAWWILKPGIASDDNPQQKAEKFAQALQIRPDFRLYANAAKHLLKMNEADLDAERKRVRATKAHEYQQIAIARAPNNLLEKLNLALIYDALDRYDEAEAIYKSIVDPLAPREYYYGTRYHYAAHLMNRGSKLWKARKPEMALFYFTQSKAELDKIKDYYIEGDVNQMRKDLESSITFLRTAKIKLPGEP
jgi:tetratricopeptide (TPR) repeat protein